MAQNCGDSQFKFHSYCLFATTVATIDPFPSAHFANQTIRFHEWIQAYAFICLEVDFYQYSAVAHIRHQLIKSNGNENILYHMIVAYNIYVFYLSQCCSGGLRRLQIDVWKTRRDQNIYGCSFPMPDSYRYYVDVEGGVNCDRVTESSYVHCERKQEEHNVGG